MAEDPENEAELKEIPASEILDKIKKGEPVVYDHVKIIGELIINMLEPDLPTEHVDRTEYEKNTLYLPEESKVVSSSIKITNSKFDSTVYFEDCLIRGPVNFGNTTFCDYVDFDDANFGGYASFERANFSKRVSFLRTTFSKNVSFLRATFSKNARFPEATFSNDADFDDVNFSGDAVFQKATFGFGGDPNFSDDAANSSEEAGFFEANFCKVSVGESYFGDATFSGYADFSKVAFVDAFFGKAAFSNKADFSEATFNSAFFGDATFSNDADFHNAAFNSAFFAGAAFSNDADFHKAFFSGEANLREAKFGGDVLTFRDATFILANSQEETCRRAKNVLENNGNREEADYHFYQEMDGRRKQKQWYFRYPEFIFVQLIFGYGVHPFRLMFSWLLVTIIFALFYSMKGGIKSELPPSSLPQSVSYFVECFYCSIDTAIGYGKYEFTSWVYQVIASAETIFGTFMWAAFITTFARKYMK